MRGHADRWPRCFVAFRVRVSGRARQSQSDPTLLCELMPPGPVPGRASRPLCAELHFKRTRGKLCPSFALPLPLPSQLRPTARFCDTSGAKAQPNSTPTLANAPTPFPAPAALCCTSPPIAAIPSQNTTNLGKRCRSLSRSPCCCFLPPVAAITQKNNPGSVATAAPPPLSRSHLPLLNTLRRTLRTLASDPAPVPAPAPAPRCCAPPRVAAITQLHTLETVPAPAPLCCAPPLAPLEVPSHPAPSRPVPTPAQICPAAERTALVSPSSPGTASHSSAPTQGLRHKGQLLSTKLVAACTDPR